MKLISHYIESSLIILMLVLTSAFVYFQDRQHRMAALQESSEKSAQSLVRILENWHANRFEFLTNLASTMAETGHADVQSNPFMKNTMDLATKLAPDIKSLQIHYTATQSTNAESVTLPKTKADGNLWLLEIPIPASSGNAQNRVLLADLSPDAYIEPYASGANGENSITIRSPEGETLYQYGRRSVPETPIPWDTDTAIRLAGTTYSLQFLPSQRAISVSAFPVNMIILIVGTITTLGTAIVLNKELRLRIDQRERYQNQLKQLSALTIESRDQEKHKLGRRLHDELGHALSLARMDVESLKTAPPSDTSKIDRAAAQIGKAVDAVRSLSSSLSLPGFFDLGFTPPLKHLTQEFEKTTGIQVQFNEEGEGPDPSFQRQVCIYRILQEALTNVMRHAQASKITVSILRQKKQISCQIQDDGIGFSQHEKNPELRGIGILGMGQRTEQSGGTFSINSKPGQGTSIRCSFSLSS